jgi:predicted 3-demethylubiquinone-9 3-methyltransferase (glyoxalase superfamily)
MYMAHIIPHLWFDTEAREAAEFYTSLFPASRITDITTIHGTPSGDAQTVSFEIMGTEFMSISAGPYFKLNPSISISIKLKENLIDNLWSKLMDGGKALMPLDSYPFSKKYGWVEDRYGLSWQLMVEDEQLQPVTISMLFVGENCGRAEHAIAYYQSLFEHSTTHEMLHDPEDDNLLLHGSFTLENLQFSAQDSSLDHRFNFNEAFSIMVLCDSQQEVDFYFEQLSADPEQEQCGWLKDSYGLFWQIIPKHMHEMLKNGTKEQTDRVTQAMLNMKKLNLDELKRAYEP